MASSRQSRGWRAFARPDDVGAVHVSVFRAPGIRTVAAQRVDAGIEFARQVATPILYKGTEIGDGFKADIIVARELILEIKAVGGIPPHSCRAAPDISADERHPRRSAAELQRAKPGGWPASLRRVGHVEANDFPP